MKKGAQILVGGFLVLIIVLVLLGLDREHDEMTYAWPIGSDSPDDAVAFHLANKFADECRRLSDGRIKIKAYANGVIGGDRELLEACEAGDIPFIVQTTAPQLDFIPETALFNLPMAFDTLAELRGTVNDPNFRQKFGDAYRKHGFRLLAISDQGFREITANKPIRDIKDLAGLKIRVMENPDHIAFWQCVGASPTPMNFGEVYIGLQQGTIDASENSYETLVPSRLYEQQKYITETRHVSHLVTLIASEVFFSGLPEEDREILNQAARIAEIYGNNLNDTRLAERKKVVTDAGAVIVDASPALRRQMLEASRPVYEMIRKTVGDDLYDAMLDARGR